MNGLIEQPEPQVGEITVKFHFVDGDSFVQTVPLTQAETVQDLLDWFRKPGKHLIWAWNYPGHSRISMLNHKYMMGIDIEGYIEPDGYDSKWYQRLSDKVRTRWTLRRWSRF